jgi:hypothetical protein
MTDWIGNSNSIYKTLGASNHTEKERQTEDFYATEPNAVRLLLAEEKFSKNIWECACGSGTLSDEIKAHGYDVYSTDLIDRGYGEGQIDFLKHSENYDGDIITNPPYKFSSTFIYKAMDVVTEGHKVAMFLKVQFLEGKARKKLFAKYPPKVIYVSSSRLLCAKNGKFAETDGSAVAYAWFVWEKGYTGDTIIKWIN